MTTGGVLYSPLDDLPKVPVLLALFPSVPVFEIFLTPCGGVGGLVVDGGI